MRTLRFYTRLARAAPKALWDAASRGQVIGGSIVLTLVFFNRPAAQSLSDWEGASPLWGVVLLGGLFLLGLLKANHEAFEREERAKAKAERERDDARRKVDRADSREALVDWLDERIREVRALQRELEPLTPPSVQTRDHIGAIHDSQEDINRRVVSRLRLVAPEWVDYFLENPDWYEPYIVRVGDEEREQEHRLLEYVAGQLNHIRENLRSSG